MGWGCSEPKVPSLGGERGCAFGITWCLREERDGEGVSKMAGEGPGVIRAGSFPEEGDEGRAMTSDPPGSHCPNPGFSSWVSAVRSSGGDSLLQIPSWGKGNPLSWLLQAAALASVLVNTRGLTEPIPGGLGACIPRAQGRAWVQGLWEQKPSCHCPFQVLQPRGGSAVVCAHPHP